MITGSLSLLYVFIFPVALCSSFTTSGSNHLSDIKDESSVSTSDDDDTFDEEKAQSCFDNCKYRKKFYTGDFRG